MKKKEVRKGASRSGKLLLKTRCVDSPKTAAVKPTALQVNVVVLAQSVSQPADGRAYPRRPDSLLGSLSPTPHDHSSS